MFKLRKSKDRGHADHGWLKSYHTFSFASYHDPIHIRFGPLRVINEDFVAPERGFDMHPHENMEIFTYVVSGELTHQDSMGNTRTLRAGEFQAMTAGSGVFHSEMNLSKKHPVHLLQIWILPNEKDLKPSYSELQPNATNDRPLTLLASPTQEDGSLKIHQEAYIYFGRMKPNQALKFDSSKRGKCWLQLIEGHLTLGGLAIKQGDGMGITDEGWFELVSNSDSSFLLFNFG